MEYQDLTLDLRSVDGGENLEATVADAPLRDNCRIVFQPPFEASELERLLAYYDRLGDPNRKEEEFSVSPREMGARIFSRLFQEEMGAFLTRCRDTVLGGSRKGLRLRLRFRPDDPRADYLSTVPWEWICHPETQEFMAIDKSTPIVREIAAPRPQKALLVKTPLRILVVDAAPATMRRLNLRFEIDRMEEALDSLLDARQVELLRLPKVTKDAMREALLDEEIHVLHFMGHGGYDPVSGLGAVFFEQDDGSQEQVDGEMMAAYLKDIDTLRLVVLNACKTARHTGHLGMPFHQGVAAAILERTQVPAIIANQYSVSDRAAIDFSGVFYDRIASGEGVDEATTEARLRLWTRSPEWATSILFLSSQSGKIFDVPAGQKRNRVREVRRRSTLVNIGIRSINGWGRDMKFRNPDFLDLTHYFGGPEKREIENPAWWNERIFPAVRTFLSRVIDERNPLLLDFAAHSSIVFAAGWVLEPKSGLDFQIRQRTGDETSFEWHAHDGSIPEGALWQEKPEIELDPAAPGIAVAVSVARPEVAGHVKAYVQRKGLPVSRILDATIAPEPGGRSVRGGAHALRLAQTLVMLIQARRAATNPEAPVHFFCAAPNALMFYLGQLSSSLGKVILYEHPFKAENAYGRYQRSIELPPPSETWRVSDESNW